MAAMSKTGRHCEEEDIANKSRSTRINYSKINRFGGGPINKTVLPTITGIRLESNKNMF
jgi:hypothetical protein